MKFVLWDLESAQQASLGFGKNSENSEQYSAHDNLHVPFLFITAEIVLDMSSRVDLLMKLGSSPELLCELLDRRPSLEVSEAQQAILLVFRHRRKTESSPGSVLSSVQLLSMSTRDSVCAPRGATRLPGWILLTILEIEISCEYHEARFCGSCHVKSRLSTWENMIRGSDSMRPLYRPNSCPPSERLTRLSTSVSCEPCCPQFCRFWA